jgi:iron complex transport system substrate-binding protein
VDVALRNFIKLGNFLLLISTATLFFFLTLTLEAGNYAVRQETLRDALGYEFILGRAPQRIISLAPNLTEILFALSSGNKIVGLTRFCNYPPEAARIEKVGGILDPSLEKIIALQPDLILAFRGTPLEVLNKLRSSGLLLFVFDEGEKITELFSLIKTIGLITRNEDKASQLLFNLESRLKEVQKRIQTTRTRPRVFITLASPGLWTCGRQSFLHDLIELAGGQNVAAFESRRWFTLKIEDLLRSSPEIIVILAPDFRAYEARKDYFLKEESLKNVPAIRASRFGWLHEDEASRFGPRLIKALEELVRLLHPEVFP